MMVFLSQIAYLFIMIFVSTILHLKVGSLMKKYHNYEYKRIKLSQKATLKVLMAFLVKIGVFWGLTYPTNFSNGDGDPTAQLRYCPYKPGEFWYPILTFVQQAELVLSMQTFAICFVIIRLKSS